MRDFLRLRGWFLVPALLALVRADCLAQVQVRAVAEGEESAPIAFSADGHTFHGDWHADIVVSHDVWMPGRTIDIGVGFRFADDHFSKLAAAGIKADKLCVLVTAERTFDADGWMRLASDERMSTLLTPTGLAIEGGVQGAVTRRYGYEYGSPLDEFRSIASSVARAGGLPSTREVNYAISTTLPTDLPPGLYRLRFDFGVMVGNRLYNFNGFTFASRPFSDQAGTSTYFYSPLFPADGMRRTGRFVAGSTVQPRIPWLLLSGYNSNGYRGVVADEDRRRFATSDRSLMPDDVILPMYDDNGNRLSYSLEPQMPADTIDARQNIEWNWTAGALSVVVTGPDGQATDLGTASFAGKSGNGPTTKKSAFTAWRPPKYGRYTVTATGWLSDARGVRYAGGGTYRFWIAKRMTLATATFQGMPYPVGASYGRDIQFNPPVAADVQVTAALYVDSSADNVRTLSYSGKASPGGLFGAAQGMKSLPLNAPGEYHAQVLATYTDGDGHLWVCSMRHAGVVYPEDSAVVARGKKFALGGKYVERGETKFEGYVEPDGTSHLAHITFPYQAGDVLLMGADEQGANKIEPVLTYQMQGDTSAWDTRLNGVGTTNLRIRTSNGYSPHLYPEYITDIEYYYAAAPRPGFMGRFLVGESNVFAPYWPVSPNSFGGQIGASANGDRAGDIYRLIGGVVLRRTGRSPMYGGYIASAFLLPRGSNNNRVIAPGSEDLPGPTGQKARFFLVGLRPGSAYEVGASFRPAVQIDPILPASITFTLTYPDGRKQSVTGSGDRFGSFAAPSAWPLDVPGVYQYQLRATWNGFEGRMPGLPDAGGMFFVYSSSRPAGTPGLSVDGPAQRTFPAASTLVINGRTTAAAVQYALIMPGAVIAQGTLPVTGGRFQFTFDPAEVHARVPLYDITSVTTGRPQIGRVIHLTFFSEERAPNGGSFFDFARIILRGTTAIAARTLIGGVQAVAAAAPSGPASPLVPLAAVDPAMLRELDVRVDQSIRSGELAAVSRTVDTIVPGRTHERLRQYHRGVPVAGGEVTRQTDHGLTVSIFGTLAPDLDVDPTPAVTPDRARAVVEEAAGMRGATGTAEPELVVLPLDAGGAALAWRLVSRTGEAVRVWFVSAATGRVLLDYDDLKRQEATVLDFRGDRLRSADVLSGRVPARASDMAAAGSVEAAELRRSLRAARDYYAARFNDRGTSVAAVVRPGIAGAFWDGRMMVFGDNVRPSAAVVAHEWTHAVVDAAMSPVHRGETLTIGEAFADILADAVARSAGADASPKPLEPDNPVTRAYEHAVAAGAARGRMEAVLYRAVIYMLPAAGGLETLRAAILQSARDVAGCGPGAECALEHLVAEAWASSR